MSEPGGWIEVVWDIAKRDDGERKLRLDWIERDGPAVTAPQKRGFGHIVIEQAAASSLLGTSNLTFDPAGVRWRLEAPESCVVTG